MKRSSTTLFLESPNSVTMVPWNDGSPDFSAFEEPTLSVLINSYTNFVGGGGTVELAPELEPVEFEQLNAPDYTSFNTYMLTNPANIAYELAVNAINPKLSQAVGLAYNNIESRGLNDFAQVFPIFCSVANVTQNHRDEWAEFAASKNLPSAFIDIIKGTTSQTA